ncbi:Flp family type IVb pilin [Pseudomonas akapageensis]|uniref:Flp family type IVb pilin n=1 Tax=Pseudomonas akapageensis TaxID=2609961 RepID=UPI00140A127D|nr:Flp family type IVb pilin [Pseudomonas akapageensis]
MSPTTFLKKIKHFVYNKDAASGIEYTILAAIVATVLLGAVPTVKHAVNNAFQKVADAVEDVKP